MSGRLGPLKWLGCSLLAVCLLGFNSVAISAVYRWVDENGITHYGDRRVPSSKKISIARMTKRRVAEAVEWTGPIDQAFLDSVEQQCSVAKDRLRVYRSAGEVYVRDSEAPSRLVARSKAKDFISTMKADVERYCAEGAGKRLYQEMLAKLKAKKQAELAEE